MDVTRRRWRGAARGLAWPVVAVAVAVAVATSVVMMRYYPYTTTSGLAPGWLWAVAVGAGALAVAGLLRLRREHRGSGAMIATGLVWLVPEWAGWSSGPVVVRTLADTAGVFLPVLALATAVSASSAPDRLTAARRVLAVAAAGAAVAAVARVTLVDPFTDPDCWRDCSQNPLLVADIPWLGHLAIGVGTAITLAAVLGGGLRLVVRAGGSRASTVVGGAALLIGTTAVAAAGPLGADVPGSWWLWVASAVATAGAVTVAGRSMVEHLRAWRLRTSLRGLVGDLRTAPAPGMLERRLADALGDPHLRIGYWSESGGTYVDADGRPVTFPLVDAARVTTIVRGGAPVAALLCHGPADAATVAQVLGPAMRLWLENEQLRAAALAELAELRASRRRIVERADGERRRLERDLHDGAQQRVIGLGLLLRRLRSRLEGAAVVGADGAALAALVARAEGLVDATLDELRRVARGIYPGTLVHAGLRGALADLADASRDLTVRVDAVPALRYQTAVELAVYRVVTEALADARERGATIVTITATDRDGALAVTITDDAPTATRVPLRDGLVAELADRVAALDGWLATAADGQPGSRLDLELPHMATVPHASVEAVP